MRYQSFCNVMRFAGVKPNAAEAKAEDVGEQTAATRLSAAHGRENQVSTI